MEITAERKNLIESDMHALVLGGPGCGKTTVALIKANHEIQKNNLKFGQKILFLSFARATVSRIIEQAGKLISPDSKSSLEINTYHGFAWGLIQSHGYLINSRPIRLLPPPEAAAKLALVPSNKRKDEKSRLFNEEALLHFDLFSTIGGEILSRSRSLLRIICDTYPLIILDEFQDTNVDEWNLIQELGKHSRLIALADAEQRIYEFRGADPKRIGEFIEVLNPKKFDFGTENYRSNGTDIVAFGNDLLTGGNVNRTYQNVLIAQYGFYHGKKEFFGIKTSLIEGIKRLKKNTADWSIAILVPTKKLMLSISDYLLSKEDSLPSINHDVAIDAEGPSLAGVLIAGLLEGNTDQNKMADQLIRDLCQHIQGRKGNDGMNQQEVPLVAALESYLDTRKINGSKRKMIIEECLGISQKCFEYKFSGDPWEDWLAIRSLLADSKSEIIQQVAEDAKYLRLLHKGAVLRSRLNELWRMHLSYQGAKEAVQSALLQEHFSMATKDWKGIHVMTIHKAKGKEFDEVFIYEGYHQGRIVRTNATPNEIAQARLTLRVAVTRAMKRTTILTPRSKKCELL